MQLAKDKKDHIKCCAGLAFLFGISAVTTLGLLKACLFGVGVAMLFGAAKKTYDALRPGGTGWDWTDILADLVGAVIGAMAVALFVALVVGGIWAAYYFCLG